MATKQVEMIYCIGCARLVNINKFNTSKNPYHKNGRLPYCKDCCNDIFKDRLSKMNSIEGATYMTCAELGVPFIRDIYQKFDEEYRVRNLKHSFAGYYTKLNTQKLCEWCGFWETDVDFNNICGVSENQQNIKANIEELILNWGKQTLEDYNFLIYIFKKYTDNVKMENPQHEDLYRDLCLQRLKLRKIREGDSSEDEHKVQASILTLMNKLKVDEFNSSKAKTLSEQSMFNLITLVNENNVKDVYTKPYKFKDFNKRKEHIEKFSYRPLGNTVAGMRDFDVKLEDMNEYEENLKVFYEGSDIE